MRAIVSHDVDHITILEHALDAFVPKQTLRSFIELCSGLVTGAEFIERLGRVVRNRGNNLLDLLRFDRETGVPAVYFVAVAKGKNLGYGLKRAAGAIAIIKEYGFEVGLHTTSGWDIAKLKIERENFQRLVGPELFGVRAHYLADGFDRNSCLTEIGFLYDSSELSEAAPYVVGGIWEFPVHIMDSVLFENGKRWQSISFREARERTRHAIARLDQAKVSHMTILFHDYYFCTAFRSFFDWYRWLIDFLRRERYSLVNYRNALRKLGTKSG